MTTNFEPANPEWCVFNLVDELENVFADAGIMLDFSQAIDNEILAVDVVENVLINLIKNNT